MADITRFKENNKTSFLAQEYERIHREVEQTNEMALSDASLQELAKDEIQALEDQKAVILAQMEDILKVEVAEDEFPNEIILEVRAAAGGDEAGATNECDASKVCEEETDSTSASFVDEAACNDGDCRSVTAPKEKSPKSSSLGTSVAVFLIEDDTGATSTTLVASGDTKSAKSSSSSPIAVQLSTGEQNLLRPAPARFLFRQIQH
jgi:hypothetical protein